MNYWAPEINHSGAYKRQLDPEFIFEELYFLRIWNFQ